MKSKLSCMTIIAGLALTLLVGCAKPPQQELDVAKAAYETARKAEADRYVTNEFTMAQDSLNVAITEIETQNSKSAFSRNYSRAKELLEFATTTFTSATQQVEVRKSQVQAEVQSLLTKATADITEAKQLIKIAPKGKEGKAALEAIQSELSITEASLQEVTILLDNGDYLTARDKVTATTEKILSLKEELKLAIEKHSMVIKKSAKR